MATIEPCRDKGKEWQRLAHLRATCQRLLDQTIEYFTGSRNATASAPASIQAPALVWILGSFCALNRIPFDAELILRQFPPPYSTDTLIHAARALGFRIRMKRCAPRDIARLTFPCAVVLNSTGTTTSPELVAAEEATPPAASTLAIVSAATDAQVTVFQPGGETPQTLSAAQFAARYAGTAILIARTPQAVKDPDGALAANRFGFRWFIPELLKHAGVWRQVIAASLVIQLLALGTPIFTQIVIDKVIVHHTESTLIVIAVGLSVFMLFSALLSWVRQYLVLHTGNRVDAVLAAGVFDHLFKLPPRYFEHRPTGVIAARLHGVETIREFVASAAVTLVLDLPFLLIFVAVMFWYSVTLTLIVLAILAAIAVLTLIVAPVFRTRLNE